MSAADPQSMYVYVYTFVLVTSIIIL